VTTALLPSAPVSTWLVPLDDTADGVVASLGLDRPVGDPASWLDADERARAARLHDATDRHRWLVSHVALRLLLGASLEVHPSAVPLTREACPRCGGPHGRPTLGHGRPLRFSLSRSEGHALVALRRGLDVGVDLEITVAGLRPSDDLARWVRTEALLKSTGEGLSRDPDAVLLRPLSPGTWGEVDADGHVGVDAEGHAEGHAVGDAAHDAGEQARGRAAGPPLAVADLALPGSFVAAVAGPGIDRARVRVHLPVTAAA
jgi:4'-phosphopantetheinyl transferase